MRSLRAIASTSKRSLQHYRVLATGAVLTWAAQSVTVLRPRERWYRDIFLLARWLAKGMRRIRPGVLDPSLEARLMHRFLDVIAKGDRRFPIPIRVVGLEILQATASGDGGFVCCSAHVPFVKLFIPIVQEQVRPGSEMMVTVKYPNADGMIDIWNSEPVQAIAAGSSVLLHTRSLLRRGGCLMLLADKEQGEYISSNIFRFVGKVGSRIVMGFPHLEQDGTILLDIVEAPAPHCRNEVEIRANLDFIAQTVRSILAGGAPPEKLRASVMPLAQVNVAERGREVDRIQLYSRSQLEARTKRLVRLLRDTGTTMADRALYEKRLSIMQQELELRSKTATRAEFGPDGRPLPGT